MSNTTAISFWEFISNYEIEIPIIQRDYAQGRKDKGVLRKKFLLSLKGALDDPNNSSLKLDFIYGANSNNKFTPIDGQQRLTTLWLLHWYIAMRAGKLMELEVQNILKRFSYETRVSSREFCKCLCNPDNFKNYIGKDIVGYIRNCTWYYSDWNQDPTINSMLTMIGGTKEYDKLGYDYIDGLEELFCEGADFSGYWEKLTMKDCPIKFYKLPLENFGLSDDLYIKMNARGKQLSAFENFKADMIGYIRERANDDATWTQLLDSRCGLPLKLDNSWTDVFWAEAKKTQTHQIHEIFFAFINRYFWNEYFISNINNTKIEDNASYKYFNADCFYSYDDFSNYRYSNGESIPISFFENLQKVLDRTYKYLNNRFKVDESKYETSFESAIQANWDNSFFFIPKYRLTEGKNIEKETEKGVKYLDITPINQVQRIAFFAICKYLKEGDIEEISFKQWMRVVWNLISGEDENGNQQIRSVDAIKEAIKFISQLKSHDVYRSLYDKEIFGNSAFDNRCKEEIEKAKQILDGNIREPWQEREKVIVAAEKYAFFKGTIRFLFTDGDGNINWSHFDQKWENVQKYFDENGVRDYNEIKYKSESVLMKSLLTNCESPNIWKWFEFSNEAKKWGNILISRDWHRGIDAILMGEIYRGDSTDNLSDHLVRELISDGLLDYICNEMPGARLRRYRVYPALWQPNKPASRVVLNPILSKLKQSKTIEYKEDNQIYNCNYYKCLQSNADFKYKEFYFRWYLSRNDTELDIYLMDINWADYRKRNIQPKDNPQTGDDSDKYFCFRVTDDMTPDAFCVELDKLIEQYNRDIASSDSHSDDVL